MDLYLYVSRYIYILIQISGLSMHAEIMSSNQHKAMGWLQLVGSLRL